MTVDITTLPALALLNLRTADASVFGVELPTVPNTLVPYGADGWIAWLGPDEWLLASTREVDAVSAELRAAAGSAPVAIVDVSSSRTIVQLSGAGARQLLAHGCALDLHPRAFLPGQCAQTRLALANVLLVALDAGQVDFVNAPVYLVLVRSSFARYLLEWLADAAVSVRSESGLHP